MDKANINTNLVAIGRGADQLFRHAIIEVCPMNDTLISAPALDKSGIIIHLIHNWKAL